MWIQPSTSTVSSLWEDVWEMWQAESLLHDVQEHPGRRGTVHNIDLEQNTVAEKKVDMVTVALVSVIVANFKASWHQSNAITPHKIDMGSDGNRMPCHIFKSYSLGQEESSRQQQKIEALF